MAKARILETRKAKKDLAKAPEQIVRSYEIWASLVEVHGSQVLREFSGYNHEKLGGEWSGYYSSRLNKKWRVIYSIEKDGSVEIVSIQRVTPHDYRRKK